MQNLFTPQDFAALGYQPVAGPDTYTPIPCAAAPIGPGRPAKIDDPPLKLLVPLALIRNIAEPFVVELAADPELPAPLGEGGLLLADAARSRIEPGAQYLVDAEGGTVVRILSADMDIVVRARVAGLLGWTIR